MPGGRGRGIKRHTPPLSQSHTAREAPILSQPIPKINFNPKGINPLVESAATLLSLASQLSTQTHDPGVAELREQVSAEIKSFSRSAKNLGIDTEIVDKASYALCTFLDEAVMATPWGGGSAWLENTLLVEFHSDAWGGENFFVWEFPIPSHRGSPV